MPNVKRLYISIIELVVGLALISMAVGFLFRYLVHAVRVDRAMETVELTTETTARPLTRLSILFQKATFLQLADQTLSVQFDHGPDPDPVWSGRMMGKIHIREQTLLLTYSPESTPSVVREEILFEHITHATWTFWKGTHPIWVTEWKERQLPPILRLVIDRPEQPSLRYAFFTSTPLQI